MTNGIHNLSKVQQAYVSMDPNFRSLGRAASSVDPLNRIPRLPVLSPESLERELSSADLSNAERDAAKLVRDNFGLIEALAAGRNDKASLAAAAHDLSHLHALKFSSDVLWTDLVDLLERCAKSGFVGREAVIGCEEFARFATANPKARGLKFICSVLRVRKALGLPSFKVSELGALKPADFYRPLQLSYLSARANDAACAKVVGWVGAAAGAIMGGLAGAVMGGAIAYVAWNKSIQVMNIARALELLNELESRGLKRYFEKSESTATFCH